ncbi:hypothetical protein WG66_012785 [Moniliophthora roreri]|nr:hypothetical protein WG66_012785 [Moniliophthora roreri]
MSQKKSQSRRKQIKPAAELHGSPACGYHNHEGCRRGSSCHFRHFPDGESIPDSRRKNICYHFIMGNCKYQGGSCWYSHNLAHLIPSKKKAQALAGRRNTIGKETDKEEFFKKMTKLKESGKFEGDLPFRKRLRGDSGALLPPENPGGFVGVSSPSNGQRGGLGEELLGVLLSLDLDDDGDVNDENVYGFSPGDVGSLVEQGNMPWDPEATAALRVLNMY